jgi:cation/acetate symporter
MRTWPGIRCVVRKIRDVDEIPHPASLFGFSFSNLLRHVVSIHPKGTAILSPQFLVKDPVSGFSLGLALMFGTSGLPHILMRFFTVPNTRAAHSSVYWASVFMNIFFALVFIIGFGSIALVASNPDFLDAAGKPLGGGNMVAIHLARALGGDALLGFISAVAFATILAVVSGLTLAAAAVSHDLYACVFCKDRVDEKSEVTVSRISTLVLGVVAVGLHRLPGDERRLLDRIDVLGCLQFDLPGPAAGAVLEARDDHRGGGRRNRRPGRGGGLTIAGPAVWVHVLGHSRALFSIDPPTIVTMPLAFVTCWAVSCLDRSNQEDVDRARSHSPVDAGLYVGPVSN